MFRACKIAHPQPTRVVIEALPGILGNRGIRSFISGEQRNKSLKLKGTGNKGNFLGTGNIDNSTF